MVEGLVCPPWNLTIHPGDGNGKEKFAKISVCFPNTSIAELFIEPTMNLPSHDESPDVRDSVAEILARANDDSDAAAELLPIVYDQLKSIAQFRMSNERPGHTLQATALVHEAFLKLVGPRQKPWQGAGHFYAAAAESMRQILLDHAKARGRQKRGGDRKREMINVVDLAENDQFENIVALDESIDRLEQENPEAAQVVRMRFYAGLSVDETAATLDMSPRTVDRRWKYARAWLYRALSDDQSE